MTETNKNLAVRKSVTPQRAPSDLMRLVTDKGADVPYYCSFDPSTDDGMGKLFDAMKTAELDAKTLANTVFNLTDWMAVGREGIVDDEGELHDRVFVTFWDDKGTRLMWGGNGPHQSFRAIRALFGDGPYNPPLPLKIVPFATGNAGRSSYIFKPEITPDGYIAQRNAPAEPAAAEPNPPKPAGRR